MIKINLLPRKKKAIPVGRELTIGIVSIILLLGAGIFLYAHFKSKISSLKNQISETKRQIQNSKVKVEQINKLKKDKRGLEQKLNLIKDMKSKQKGPASLLKDICLFIPEKVWLTSLSLKSNQITMEGISLTANSIAHFMKNLETIPRFSQVELDKITQTTRANKKVKQFKITCSIVESKSKQEKKGKS